MKRITIAISILMLLTGCLGGQEPKESNSGLIEFISSDYLNGYTMRVVKDTQTGCHYLWGVDSSIEPRLNKDGTQYCD